MKEGKEGMKGDGNEGRKKMKERVFLGARPK
jgi:hypothetical protein